MYKSMATSEDQPDWNKKLYSQDESGMDTEDIWVNNVETTGSSCEQEMAEEKQNLLRRKKLNTLFLSLAYACFGLTLSILGPAFLDLIQIAQVQIDTGAVMFTSGAVGYLSGCLLCGFVLEKVNQDILLFLATFTMGAFNMSIPWGHVLAGISVLQACFQFCIGFVDTAVNVVCMVIWGVKAGPYLQVIYFLFAVGGIVGPLIIEPFLMDKSNNTKIVSNGSDFINKSLDTVRIKQLNSTERTLSHNPETRIHVAFLICGLIAVTASFLFIYQYFLNKGHDKWNRDEQGDQEYGDGQVKLTLSSKIVYLCLLAVYFMVYISVEGMCITFMAAFVVEYGGMSKCDSANLMSVFWGTFAISRLLSVPMAKVLSPWRMLVLDFISMSVTLILLCFLAHITTFLWAAAALLGLSIASVYPASFAWIEIRIMPINGRIASLFLICGSVGNVINLLITGYLFENYTPMWFVWLLSGECTLIVALFSLVTILSKLEYGHCFTATRLEVVVEKSLLQTDV